MINKFKNNKGFTILESIVAIAILSLSVSGAFSAVQQSLSQATIAKDEVKAFYLAQEAIEIIRNKRDANQLNKILNDPSFSWLNGIAKDPGDPCYFNKICRVDAISALPVRCGDTWDTCPVLNQNQTTFLYSYNAGDPATNFKREIQIEQISADEITVTVRVSWAKGIINKEFKVKAYLLNWI